MSNEQADEMFFWVASSAAVFLLVFTLIACLFMVREYRRKWAAQKPRPD